MCNKILGLCPEAWQVVSSIGSVGAAVGTVAAVVVSLRLAWKADKPVASVEVGERLLVEQGQASEDIPSCVYVEVANQGDRPIQVVALWWCSGFTKRGPAKRRAALQALDPSFCKDQLPKDLNHGQRAQFMFKTEPWIEEFSRGMLLPHWRFRLFSLRFVAISALGHRFSVKPDASVVELLKKHCKEVSS